MKRTSSVIMLGICSLALFVGGCDFLNRFIPQSMEYKSCRCSSCKEHHHGHGHDHGHNHSSAESNTVVSINNKAVATQGDFVEFVNQAIKATPYLGAMGIKQYSDMDRTMLEQLLDSFVKQKLIVQWGYDSRINRTPEFVEKRRKMLEQVEQLIIAQEFEKRLNDKISLQDDDVASAYEQDKQYFVKNAGGVELVGCSFDAKEDAQRFYDAIVGKSTEAFTQAANESKGTFKEFGLLSKDPRVMFSSPIPAPVRSAALALERVGASQVVEDGDTHWVVLITGVHEAEYASFDEVREQLTQKVRNDKLQLLLQAELTDLQSKYSVDTDTSFLPEAAPAQQQDLQKLLGSIQQESNNP